MDMVVHEGSNETLSLRGNEEGRLQSKSLTSLKRDHSDNTTTEAVSIIPGKFKMSSN